MLAKDTNQDIMYSMIMIMTMLRLMSLSVFVMPPSSKLEMDDPADGVMSVCTCFNVWRGLSKVEKCPFLNFGTFLHILSATVVQRKLEYDIC